MSQNNEDNVEFLENIKNRILELNDKLSQLDKSSIEDHLREIISYIDNEKKINQIIMNLKEELNHTSRTHELNLIFFVIPLGSLKKKFTINNNMKNFLKENVPQNSQGKLIYERPLRERNNYFVNECDNHHLGRSVIIYNRGILIYGLHFNPFHIDIFDENSRYNYELRLYEIIDNFLGFLKYLNQIFKKIEYRSDFQLKLQVINGLSQWHYTYGRPETTYECINELSEIISNSYSIEEVSENKESLLRDMIGPILNCYNRPRDEIDFYYQIIRDNF